MKAILLQGLLLVLLILGCKDTTQEKGHPTDIIQKIPKHLEVIEYKYHFGIRDSIGVLTQETFFDSLGNQTENSNYYDGKIRDKNIFRYDYENRLSEQLIYGDDGKLKLKTIYKYDDKDKIISEVNSLGEGADQIDKMLYGNGEKTYQYEYYNDSLLSKTIMFNKKVKKTITENEYDSHLRLINVYTTEGDKKSLSEKLTYYDNNKEKEIIWFFKDVKWIWNYNIVGDTIKLIRYSLKGQIEFRRIEILDSDGRYISMQGFDSLGEPKFLNKYYYEYY